ncbi:MAG: transposase [Sphingomonadaceae bacterium]
MERLRNPALARTQFAWLQTSSLRSKLRNIGAVIVRNTRRVRVLLSSAHPYQAVCMHALRAIDST